MTEETKQPALDEILTPEQAAEMVDGRRVSPELVRKALLSGALDGRNLGGSVGWITTRRAMLEWARGKGGV